MSDGFPSDQGTSRLAPHRGVMILIFGILGLVCCLIFGIAAWLMGGSDLKEMDAGRMDPSGRDLTNVGRILGIVAVALQLIGILAYVFLVLVAAGGAMM